MIEVCGRGGHGARPHKTIDPIAAAAQLVTLIYQAVPRQTDAREPLVVTIGVIQGGSAENIIPDTVLMKGTIRSFNREVSDHARRTIQRLCAGTARAFGASINARFDRLLAGVVNDPTVTDICLKTARRFIGQDQVETNRKPTLGAEDFADYLDAVPGCMILIGVKATGKNITPLHTNTFNLDEGVLPLGVRLFAQILLEWPV